MGNIGLIGNSIIEQIREIIPQLSGLPEHERIEAINEIKISLHEISPLKAEPVDCVLWVQSNHVLANDYNPNQVAPPEMRLLEISISNDGYTQPIVTWPVEDHFEVVDGFHRSQVGKESKSIKKRILGYLPITIINQDREDKGDRIAATIRHNRARGKHQVQGMSDIVLELKRRNWTDEKICKQLGMDTDEVLRLAQIQGLAEMFANQEFSEAWEIDQ
jgi:ParB-like chromosome segregation protein Spo0J